ncbi:MAG: prepilin-type N-terminal cleavage/methylation domain-containing protein [Acidobacteriota bacterium]
MTIKPSQRRGRRGFSLTELLVVMSMLAVIMAGLVVIFQNSTRLAFNQTELAGVQQSLRISHMEVARYVRMAGAGGMPVTWNNLPDPDVTPVTYDTVGAFPNGFAVALTNNAPEDARIPETDDDDDESAHWVIPGSDVLTVRGVLTTPVYFWKPGVDIEGWVEDGVIDTQTLEIPDRINMTYHRPLDPLINRIEEARGRDPQVPLAFIGRDLMNPDAYVIFRLDFAQTDTTLKDCTSDAPAGGVPFPDDKKPKCITLGLKFDKAEEDFAKAFGNLMLGTNLTDAANSLSLTLPGGSTAPTVRIPKRISSIGLLEEYRFYVRAEWEVPGDKRTRLTPALTRAEFVPGTEQLIDRVDVVENVIDLQVAVGIDTDRIVGAVGKDLVTEAEDDSADEVLFNDPNDLPLDEKKALLQVKLPADPPEHVAWFNPELEYHYLRITTVAETTRPDLNHRAPALGTIEDVNRRQSFKIDEVDYNYNEDLRYRRRMLTTLVDMRNLK